jgi:hypothetical protein
MSQHVSVSPTEAADRLAIRELVEAYAHCADRRDAQGQMALFTDDTHFLVYMNAKDPMPSQELHSRAALAPRTVIIVIEAKAAGRARRTHQVQPGVFGNYLRRP